MFYPADCLRRGGRFHLCWVADSWPLRFETVTIRQLWSQDVREICEDLSEFMMRESGTPANRFSLRLSSQLMRGLVRVYQKKVNSFLGDLCMLESNLLRKTNRKFDFKEKPVRKLPTLPKLVITELPEIDNLEQQMMLDRGNLTNNLEDITLKEITTPVLPIPIVGFGEENIEQTLQMFKDNTVELMMAGDENAVAQLSGVDVSNLQAQDLTERSRDITKLHADVQMERLSEHDDILFRQSMAVDDLLQNQAEIPQIPEIQPNLPAPVVETMFRTHPIGELQNDEETAAANDITVDNVLKIHAEIENLEELDSRELPHRPKKSKLIVDKKIMLHGDYFRSRVQNNFVELRCQTAAEDRIDPRLVPAEKLLSQAGWMGSKPFERTSYKLKALYIRNLGVGKRSTDRDMELPRYNRAPRTKSKPKSTLQTIAEEVAVPLPSAVHSRVEQAVAPQEEVEKTLEQELVEMFDAPTQILRADSPQKRRVSEESPAPPKKSRLSQSASKRISDKQQSVEENLPQEPVIISDMLEAAGLADLRASLTQPTGAPAPPRDSQRKPSDSSETPLGSLDRTKVSLGDSYMSSESNKKIFELWGTEGTMFRIVKLFKRGNKTLTVTSLLRDGPAVAGKTRLIAARCFTSLLKLKQHNFVKLEKDQESFEITSISLTDNFLQNVLGLTQ